MALDYLSQIKPLEDEGQTDQQIADYYRYRTVGPIECSDAKVVLEESGLVIEDPITRVRSGTLVDRYNAMTNPQLKALLGWFISHVFGRGVQISSHTNPRDAQLAAVLADLPPAMQAVGQQLIALGGGQPNIALTAADVAQTRTDWQTAEAERQAQEAADQAAALARQQHADWYADYLGRFNSAVAPVLDDSPNRDNAALVAALQALATDLNNNPWSP